MPSKLAPASAFLLLALGSAATLAGDGPAHPKHPSLLKGYGISGKMQAIGLKHGFHIAKVAPGSEAEEDGLHAGDIIVKVAGDAIRSDSQFLEDVLLVRHKDGIINLEVKKIDGSYDVVEAHFPVPRDDK